MNDLFELINQENHNSNNTDSEQLRTTRNSKLQTI